MSMQDPIADMLTRIRNAQRAGHFEVSMPSSKVKVVIAALLKQEGYITEFEKQMDDNAKASLKIVLKYHAGKPVIQQISRVSRSSMRVYRSHDNVPKVLGGLGVSILSTSKGMMTDRQAKAAGVGGEVVCVVA